MSFDLLRDCDDELKAKLTKNFADKLEITDAEPMTLDPNFDEAAAVERVLQQLGLSDGMDDASVWSAELCTCEPDDREEIVRSEKIQRMKLRVDEKEEIMKLYLAKHTKQISEIKMELEEVEGERKRKIPKTRQLTTNEKLLLEMIAVFRERSKGLDLQAEISAVDLEEMLSDFDGLLGKTTITLTATTEPKKWRTTEKKIDGVVLYYTNNTYRPPVTGHFPITTFLLENTNEADPEKRFTPTKTGGVWEKVQWDVWGEYFAKRNKAFAQAMTTHAKKKTTGWTYSELCQAPQSRITSGRSSIDAAILNVD